MTSKMVTTPLSKYQIAETKTFEKVKKKIDMKLGIFDRSYRLSSLFLFYFYILHLYEGGVQDSRLSL